MRDSIYFPLRLQIKTHGSPKCAGTKIISTMQEKVLGLFLRYMIAKEILSLPKSLSSPKIKYIGLHGHYIRDLVENWKPGVESVSKANVSNMEGSSQN